MLTAAAKRLQGQCHISEIFCKRMIVIILACFGNVTITFTQSAINMAPTKWKVSLRPC